MKKVRAIQDCHIDTTLRKEGDVFYVPDHYDVTAGVLEAADDVGPDVQVLAAVPGARDIPPAEEPAAAGGKKK